MVFNDAYITLHNFGRFFSVIFMSLYMGFLHGFQWLVYHVIWFWMVFFFMTPNIILCGFWMCFSEFYVILHGFAWCLMMFISLYLVFGWFNWFIILYGVGWLVMIFISCYMVFGWFFMMFLPLYMVSGGFSMIFYHFIWFCMVSKSLVYHFIWFFGMVVYWYLYHVCVVWCVLMSFIPFLCFCIVLNDLCTILYGAGVVFLNCIFLYNVVWFCMAFDDF